MLTDDEIAAIKAEGYLDGPVPALLADRQELVALARELAEAYECVTLQGRARLLAKARAAGLLEADRG